jgi:hypothetical protein
MYLLRLWAKYVAVMGVPCACRRARHVKSACVRALSLAPSLHSARSHALFPPWPQTLTPTFLCLESLD